MGEIKKLYDIQLLGEKQVVEGMQRVNKEFDSASKTLRILKNNVVSGGNLLVDPKELDKERAALLEAEKALIRETARKKEAKAEAQALLAARQTERNDVVKGIGANKSLEGSYNDLLQRIREMKAEQKKNVNLLNIDDEELHRGNAEIRELQDRINAFNRSLSSEGTNVGEYTRGIINAFKENGLDDLIKNQIDKSKIKVNELDKEFSDLILQMNVMRTEGAQNFDSLEKKIIENRNEAEKLGKQLHTVQSEFKGIGNIGEQVSNGLKSQFKSLKGEVTNFVLGYASFQVASNFLSKLKDEAVAFDSVNASLKAVSESETEYALNQGFLNHLAENYGQNLLQISQAYKNFYTSSTQAGIAQDKTRSIFESVIDAASVLKLKQDDVNGVLLAFGQIASKGKVQAEELRGQIGERLPGAFAIAARAMGVTEKELNKMMEKGEVASKDFLPKFAAELQKTFSNGGKEVIGLQAEMNRLDNLISKIASNQSFIDFIGLMVSGLSFLAKTVTSIPFGVWITFITLLTAAYWSNIVALGAKIVAVGEYVIVQGLANGLIAIGTTIELAQAAASRALAAAKWLLNGAVTSLVARIPLLRAAWLALNTTFLATPLGWLLAALLAVGVATAAFADTVDSSTKKIKANGEAMKLRNEQMRQSVEIQGAVNRQTKETVDTVSDLVRVLKSETATHEEKVEALKKLHAMAPDYLGDLNESNILTAEGEAIIKRYIKALDNLADAEARVALKKKIRSEQLDNENKINALKAEKVGAKGSIFGDLADDGRIFGFEVEGRTKQSIQTDIEQAKAAQAALDRQYNAIDQGNTKRIEQLRAAIAAKTKQLADVKKGSDAALKLEMDIANNQKALDILLGLSKDSDSGADDPNKKGSKLTGEQRDFLKDVDADRDRLLAIEKKKRIENLIDEETYLNRVLKINKDAIDKKLGYLKGANAEERKNIAELQLERVTNEKETQDAIFKIREDAIKQELENGKANSQNRLDTVENDPQSTKVQKEEAEQAFYEENLALQVKFNNAMDALEKDFAQSSKKNAGDRANSILKIEQDINRNLYELSQARYDAIRGDINDFASYRKNNSEIEASKKRILILNDKSLSQKEKEIELEKINAALALANVNTELGAVDAEIALNEERFKTLRRTNEEQQAYNDLLLKRQQLLEGKALAEQEVKIKGIVELEVPSDSATQEALKSKILKLFSLDESKYGNLLGDVLAQSFSTAQMAMQSYFDSERANIEASKQHTLERIDIEQRQLLNQAQSQAERDSIERQSQVKREKAEKEAGARLKKVKKSEAAISLATELANIAVASAGNPANAFTFGAAGIAMYGVLSGLALARYALTVANINKQQFGRGGVPLKGGQFSGPSHASGGIPARVDEFEGDELAIINKKSAQSNQRFTVSGTPKQIASAINEVGGGVSFASGAIFKKYSRGGYFGSSVQPPVFTSYYTRTQLDVRDNYSNDRMDNLENALVDLAGIVGTESKKKVVLDPHEVTDAQRDKKIQTDIATL